MVWEDKMSRKKLQNLKMQSVSPKKGICALSFDQKPSKETSGTERAEKRAGVEL